LRAIEDPVISSLDDTGDREIEDRLHLGLRDIAGIEIELRDK